MKKVLIFLYGFFLITLVKAQTSNPADTIEYARSKAYEKKFAEADRLLTEYNLQHADINALRLHAQVLYWMRDFKRSGEIYQKALGSFPGVEIVKLDYGRMLFETGKLIHAQEMLEDYRSYDSANAEVNITAIRIHAEGWRSVYTPVIVSRGLVPEDLGSFCRQQLKWARGVHEVLFAEVPRLWKKLSFWQRISYLTIGTYYFSGVTMFLFLLIPYFFFLFGWLPANMDFIEFLLNWVPVGMFGLIIYLYVQQWTCHPEKERGLHWRGMILKFACWPVFFTGFILSLKDADLPYIPTAKRAAKGFTVFARPLIFHFFLFIITVAGVVTQRAYFTPEARLALSSGNIWGMVAFAAIAFIMVSGGIYAAWQSQKIKQEDPWTHVDVTKIETKK